MPQNYVTAILVLHDRFSGRAWFILTQRNMPRVFYDDYSPIRFMPWSVLPRFDPIPRVLPPTKSSAR